MAWMSSERAQLAAMTLATEANAVVKMVEGPRNSTPSGSGSRCDILSPTVVPGVHVSQHLTRFMKIIQLADQEPNRTASDGKIIADLCEIFLSPIGQRVALLGGPKQKAIGGETRTRNSQFVAELRLEVPPFDDLFPRIRIALEGGGAQARLYDIGVTVGQRWTPDRGEGHAAHVRWGFWTHDPKVVDRIARPFRYVCQQRGWDPTLWYLARPITNLPSFHLSMLGQERDVAQLARLDTLEDLMDEIARDLVSIAGAIRKEV